MPESKPRQIAKKRTKADQRAVARELILDAAEELFSHFGLFGVTIRDVAGKVGVDPALVHYYFTNKQTLFDEVFARRAVISNEQRIAALERYEAEHEDDLTIEGALHVFLDMEFDRYIEGGEGWKNFGCLIAQVSNARGWGADKMDEHFDHVVRKLVGILHKAMPACSVEDIYWCYHFVSGALMLSLARTGRIDRLSGGLCSSEDFQAIKVRMAGFMSAGFRQVCEKQSSTGAPSQV